MRRLAFSLLAGLPLCFSALCANAMTIGVVAASPSSPGVTLVRDGCGIGYNRGPLGYCRPNNFRVQDVPPIFGGGCPPTYHPGPFGRRCFSNY